MKKKKIKLIFYLLLFFAVERFCYQQTAGFRMQKIMADFSPVSEWEYLYSSKQEEEISQILKQRFFFLGKGVQCYAFISEDRQFVLKVFKQYHSWPSNTVLNKIPFLGQRLYKQRMQRVKDILNSCKIAYEDLQEQTAVFYVHLNPTENRYPSLTIHDKLNIAHDLPLDQVSFVLQKKADLVYDALMKQIQSRDQEAAKHSLDEILKLICNRCHKGIQNSDPIIHRNLGFIEGKAVEIDIGSFCANPHMKTAYAIRRELFYETYELAHWLKKTSPELSLYFEQKLHEMD